MNSQTFVVVGAGLAAATAIEELRSTGFEGDVVLYGAEPHLPYERPPLSKGYLLGNDELASAFVHDANWYAAQHIDVRLGQSVSGIDPAGHRVRSADGEQHYDRLLIATGASPRHLDMADRSGAAVAYLRTVEDSQRLKEAFTKGARIVIVGAGWIGLEVAAAARHAGVEVTVLESLDLPLLRVLGPEVAGVFAELHRQHGVDLRLGVQVSAIERQTGSAHQADRALVRLGDGTAVEADLVLVGIGVTPNIDLARNAGLATGDGILVDRRLTTSHPDVFAVGDVAAAEHPTLGRRVRVEHWDTAIEQGRTAAHAMLGKDVTYDRLPYFFSDQYDLGMEYVGSVGPDGYDRVVLRGDTSEAGGRVFTAFWMRGGQVLAGMHANDWDAVEQVRAVVGRRVDPERLQDASVPLEELAEA